MYQHCCGADLPKCPKTNCTLVLELWPLFNKVQIEMSCAIFCCCISQLSLSSMAQSLPCHKAPMDSSTVASRCVED